MDFLLAAEPTPDLAQRRPSHRRDRLCYDPRSLGRCVGPPRWGDGRPGGRGVERAVEWFVAITSLVVGASHVVRAGDWVEAFGRLHRGGRPAAFVNGAL